MLKNLLLSIIAMLSCSMLVTASESSFIKEQIKQINNVLVDNHKSPNDPKAEFSADEEKKVLTIFFERNKPLAGQNKEAMSIIAAMLPNTLLETVYIHSNGIVNGTILRSMFVKKVQKEEYTIKVIIKGSDTQFEFQFPSDILTLKE